MKKKIIFGLGIVAVAAVLFFLAKHETDISREFNDIRAVLW